MKEGYDRRLLNNNQSKKALDLIGIDYVEEGNFIYYKNEDLGKQ